jgi:hypothetical protein
MSQKKAHENEITPICFILFFRITPFQSVAAGKRTFFFLPGRPLGAAFEAPQDMYSMKF